MPQQHQTMICTRPFEWFEVHADGSVFLCCPAWLRRPAGNLLRQPINEIWNGPVAEEIRKSILNGSFHNCSARRCPSLASQRPPIKPITALVEGRVAEAIRKGQTRLEYPPVQLNLAYDLRCNLACASCRSSRSSLGAAEQIHLETIQKVVEQQLIPLITTLTLSGYGDPFASPGYLQILRRLSPETAPRLKCLRLHTNGQLFTPQTWDLLPGLHCLLQEVEISLDAASEETYRQNRQGGELGVVLENLAFLAGLPIKRRLSMVVQRNNWQEIPEFLQLAERYHAQAFLSPLVNWGTFSREEYLARAVHLPSHPDYPALQTLLENLPRSEEVDLGCLPYPA